MESSIEVPSLKTRLSQDYFEQQARVVVNDLLGMTIVHRISEDELRLALIREVSGWQGKVKSSAKTIGYTPGTIGISKKYGHNLIDIATGSHHTPSCIMLVALNTPEGLVEGPGKVSKYLSVDDSSDKTPVDGTQFWIGGDAVSPDRIKKREKSNLPENCIGYFYYT